MFKVMRSLLCGSLPLHSSEYERENDFCCLNALIYGVNEPNMYVHNITGSSVDIEKKHIYIYIYMT